MNVGNVKVMKDVIDSNRRKTVREVGRCAKISMLQYLSRSLDSGWFGDMFQKWEKRNRKCIAHNGEYFEKYSRYGVSVDDVVSERRVHIPYSFVLRTEMLYIGIFS